VTLKKMERQRRDELWVKGLKVCSRCNEVKPVDEFNKNKSSRDGLDHRCRACISILGKKRNADNPYMVERRKKKALFSQGLKRCTRCSRTLSLTDFNKRTRMSDGLSSWCRDCEAEYRKWYRSNPENVAMEQRSSRAWKERNPERVRELSKQWAAANPEHKRKMKRKWHAEHKEEENAKARERTLQWIKDNPERAAENGRRYRARQMDAEGNFTEEEWGELLELCGGVCLNCGADENICRDHIEPLIEGGCNYIWNIQPLCKSCNSSKGANDDDYRPEYVKEWARQMEDAFRADPVYRARQAEARRKRQEK
jgi:5-methylcytosine-specific restriction endonuclease McrA